MIKKIALIAASIAACVTMTACDSHKGEHCTAHTLIIMPQTTTVGKSTITTYVPINTCSQWTKNAS